jgi:hypothetical protein
MTQYASLDELIEAMNAKPSKITLAWEVLPALDGTLHAVDPDPDAHVTDEYAVSLCGRALQISGAVVIDNNTCPVCLEISAERQREFDAEVA